MPQLHVGNENPSSRARRDRNLICAFRSQARMINFGQGNRLQIQRTSNITTNVFRIGGVTSKGEIRKHNVPTSLEAYFPLGQDKT